MPENKNHFVQLLSSNYSRIMAFIFTLVPCAEDADDIMQQTAMVAWEKFDQFEIGTNFTSWAVTIAKYQVLSYRKKYNAKVSLSEELIETLAEESKTSHTQSHARLDALRSCLKRLSVKERKLIHYRFENRLTAKILSKQFGVPMGAIYRNETRILDMLLNCVRKHLETSQL